MPQIFTIEDVSPRIVEICSVSGCGVTEALALGVLAERGKGDSFWGGGLEGMPGKWENAGFWGETEKKMVRRRLEIFGLKFSWFYG